MILAHFSDGNRSEPAPHTRSLRVGQFAKTCGVLLAIGLIATIDGPGARAQSTAVDETSGAVELDVRTRYSHVRVRRKGSYRSLIFVRDTGYEAVESTLDLDRPHELVFDYTRFMFLSYLFQPQPEKVLIVGLGGGSMVHFLKHYDPNVSVNVVEIDPEVVRIADRYFGVQSAGNVRILRADILEYLAGARSTAPPATPSGTASGAPFRNSSPPRYDVIYMDAFLKPARDTDRNGVPLRLKTAQFYKQVRQALNPAGVAVFNLNPSARMRDDIAAIGRAFPQTFVYRIPRSKGAVVVASLRLDRDPASALLQKAEALDNRFKTAFSFKELAGRLSR